MPAIRFSIVVLPAPLGPISPWTVPPRTLKSTLSTATRPPNRRPTPRTIRWGQQVIIAKPGDHARQRAHDPVGANEHVANQDRAIDHHTVIIHGVKVFWQEHDDSGTHNRALDAANSTNDTHDEDVHGFHKIEV